MIAVTSLLPKKFKYMPEMTLMLFMVIILTSCKIDNGKLQEINEYDLKVLCSKGAGERAQKMASRCEQALMFYNERFGFKPDVSLMVLDPHDWKKYTGEMVYGMPFYDDKKLVVAAHDNEFWRSFVPPAGSLPDELARKIKETYSDEDGNLTMLPFFDLLAIHELAHGFHLQKNINMQRKWMSELFANYFLHAYIAENEPELLNEVTLFPDMVLTTTKRDDLTFTSLHDFENHYANIARKHPGNYGWYQCRLIEEAEKLYIASGMEILQKMWIALNEQKEKLNNQELPGFLSEKISPHLANVMSDWESE